MNQTIEHAYKATHIKKAALDIENNSTNFFWQLKHLAKILPSLRKKNFRKGVGGILKGFLVHYRKANRAVFEKEINVELPIDKEIPFDKTELGNYLSFVGFWISGINYIHKEFGQASEEDIAKFLQDMGEFYPEAAKVFNAAQTSLTRVKPETLKFKILHFVDTSKNASPSLHVEVAAHTYSRLSDILDKQAGKMRAAYEPIKKALFKRAVKILESVLLVKQHTILDVSLGLAALSAQDKTFTQEKALKLIDNMFVEHEHHIPKELAQNIKKTLTNIYLSVLAQIAQSPYKNQAEIFIDYLKNLDTKKSSL